MDFSTTQLLNFNLESNTRASNSILNSNVCDFGFTIAGYCPTYILNVDETSNAYRIGLKNGDCIVKINGINCCRATLKTIIRLINKNKQSNGKLNMCIHRTTKPSSRFEHLLAKQHKKLEQKRKLKSILFCAPLSDLIKKSTKSTNIESLSSSSLTTTTASVKLTRENSLQSIQNTADTGYETQSLSIESEDNFAVISVDETRRANLISKLLDLEMNFVCFLNDGVSTFSRPLRGFFLRQQDYFNLFQNIEKILVITENFLQSMTKWTSSDLYAHVGQFYSNKIKLLDEALRFYVHGYSQAKLLLNDLKLNSKKFRAFLNETETHDVNLNSFLDLPIFHFNQIFELLTQIRNSTSKSSQEFNNLQATIDNLKDIFDDVELVNDESLITSIMQTPVAKKNCLDEFSHTTCTCCTTISQSNYSSFTCATETSQSPSTTCSTDTMYTLQETTIFL